MKTKESVEGYRRDCFYYDPCPICYGCRNYRKYYDYKCVERCGHSIKHNVCISKLHTPENFNKMLRRPPVLDLDKIFEAKERNENE